LSRAAQKFEGEVIVFCGVVFMAETAKVLNPSRTIVLPDLDSGCSTATIVATPSVAVPTSILFLHLHGIGVNFMARLNAALADGT